MWSNQLDGTMYFARHADGAADTAWTQEIAYSRLEGSDDHISLKADSSGRVYAAVKTRLTARTIPWSICWCGPPDGIWTTYVYSTSTIQHTRAVVVINEAAGLVYVFASAPCCSGGIIYYKAAPINAISFSPGLGTSAIQSSLEPEDQQRLLVQAGCHRRHGHADHRW